MAENKFYYGGQAIIEGVMMRGKKHFAVAVRRMSGAIETKTENVETLFGKMQWLNKPFLRGTLALIDSMYLGIKSLTYSANIAMEDAEAAEKAAKGEAVPEVEKKEKGGINDITVGFTVVIGMIIAMALFMGVPIVLTRFLNKLITVPWLLTVIEGLIKIGIFVGYVWAISFMPDIQRVFKYHGAEHKTINAYEAGAELVPEEVKKYTKVHVRCGTSFILVVLLASIFVFILVADHLPNGSLTGEKINILFRWIYKLVLLPIVAGISYEIIKFAGKHKDAWYTKIILAPGLMMQSLTTKEPEEEMLEVAIASLKSVFEAEEAEENV